MSDQSALHPFEPALCAEADAEISQPSPSARSDSDVAAAPAAPKTAPLDSSSFSRRIHDNLNWASIFDYRTTPFPPVDLWPEIKALWAKSDKEFVTGLYEVLLGRAPERAGLESACEALANGASRVALVRLVALSEEAKVSELDVSWLSRLDEMESDAVWEKVQSLWNEPDHVFVVNLYPLLLVRPPEREGMIAHCRALKSGMSRAAVVRAFALSDEARLRGLKVSWLPRLDALPAPAPPRPRLSFDWLKTAFRGWRNGNKTATLTPPAIPADESQPLATAAKGGRL